MAVNKITNKHTLNRESVNRAEQISSKDRKVRGNAEQSINPGKDFTKNFSVTLKDIDTSVMSHIKDVMKPKIREANEVIKVPVYYGNEERWKAFRKRGVLRDKNGSLILPLIMFRRTDVSFDDNMPMSFDHDVNGEFIKVARSNKWSKDNQYDRFSVQQGVQPTYDVITTGMPNYTDVTYEFVLWTNFIEQMNPLVESFVDQSHTYWGDGTNNKFLCTIDSVSDASEMNQDGERFIKSTFTVTSKAYLLPEYLNSVVTDKVSNMKKETTPSRVTFGYEGDATDEQVGK